MSDGKENVTYEEDLFLLTSAFFEVGCRSLIATKFTCNTNKENLSRTPENRGTPDPNRKISKKRENVLLCTKRRT